MEQGNNVPIEGLSAQTALITRTSRRLFALLLSASRSGLFRGVAFHDRQILYIDVFIAN